MNGRRLIALAGIAFTLTAANAVAAPWFPPDAATTPAAGTTRESMCVNAARALNEPACCMNSSLNTSELPGRSPNAPEAMDGREGLPGRRKSSPATSMIGVRRMWPSISLSTSSMFLRVRAGSIIAGRDRAHFGRE